jgi:hypothetical protein
MQRSSILALTLFIGTAVAEAPVPVMVGGDENMDVCPSVGVITDVAPDATGEKLAVRSGPSKSFPIVATLKKGAKIWLCSSRGGWSGVVFPDSKDGYCEVSSPIVPEQPYQGKCKSGWISESALELVAG